MILMKSDEVPRGLHLVHIHRSLQVCCGKWHFCGAAAILLLCSGEEETTPQRLYVTMRIVIFVEDQFSFIFVGTQNHKIFT